MTQLLGYSWKKSQGGNSMKTKQRINEELYSKPYLISKSSQERVNHMVKLVGKNKKVLDIGCYDGTISKLIKDNGNDVYGVDISEPAVELARLKGIQAKRADIEEEIPFPNGFFDVIVMGEVIEHIFDTDNFLKNIRKLLKVNGYVIITTPNLAALGRRILLLFGKNPLIESSCKEGSHIRYLVKDTIFSLLKSNGFTVDIFTSDVVNFTKSGIFYSAKLAKLFPTLGRTLIMRAKVENNC